MSTDSDVEDRSESRRSVTDRLSSTDAGDVLIYGPAMSGKRDLGLDMLVEQMVATGGRPFYVSTSDPAREARGAVDARIPEGSDLPTPGIVTCSSADEVDDELTTTVGTPADLSGIALALSEMFGASRRSRRLGSRVLVDNVGTMLMYADLQPVYRFLHALTRRVEEEGGATIATLDTDGLAEAERPTLVSLFDTLVEVRREGGEPTFRIHENPDGWAGRHSEEKP